MTKRDAIERAVAAEERLADDLASYEGRWVAVRDHAVVADADTVEALLGRVDVSAVDRVFQVDSKAFVDLPMTWDEL